MKEKVFVSKSINWMDRELYVETGRIARNSLSAVFLRYGGTSILCNVNSTAGKEKEAYDFLPLSVHFMSKAYAFGKIPGGFFKREGKPSSKEVLISRIIDRSIRPLFDKKFCSNTIVNVQLLSHDCESDIEIAAVIGAMAALSISGLPVSGMVSAARVCLENDKFVVNPHCKISSDNECDLLVSSTKDSILMVEASMNELPESRAIEALSVAQSASLPVIEMIEEFSNQLKEKDGIPDLGDCVCAYDSKFGELKSYLSEKYREHIVSIYENTNRFISKPSMEKLKKSIIEEFDARDDFDSSSALEIIASMEKEIVRDNIVDNNRRLDGRTCVDIRDISVECGILGGVTHGDALFTRGGTQALAVVTFGSMEDTQVVDELGEDNRKDPFMLHYNFLPYAVAEAAPPRAVSRREIGHGKLAHKAVLPILPSFEGAQHCIRVVSEITESDGSSSMATVCASSLALMDAGVRVKSPVAGIAMGLIKKGSSYAILSDILGDEDNLGDMDFKVAGTEKGITALQMDMKISGISIEVLTRAVSQAKRGRMHILSKMSEVLSSPRDTVKEFVPKVEKVTIDKDKIREVIGVGGKNIKGICEKSGAKVEISQDGTVSIMSASAESRKIAKDAVLAITMDIERGKCYDVVAHNKVSSGFLVKLPNNKPALLPEEEFDQYLEMHSSEIKEGDKFKAWVKSISKFGDRINVSLTEPDTTYDSPSRGGGFGSDGNGRPGGGGPRRSSRFQGNGNRGGNKFSSGNRGNVGGGRFNSLDPRDNRYNGSNNREYEFEDNNYSKNSQNDAGNRGGYYRDMKGNENFYQEGDEYVDNDYFPQGRNKRGKRSRGEGDFYKSNGPNDLDNDGNFSSRGSGDKRKESRGKSSVEEDFSAVDSQFTDFSGGDNKRFF